MSENVRRLVEWIERAVLAGRPVQSCHGRELDRSVRETLVALLGLAPTRIGQSCLRAALRRGLVHVPDSAPDELLADLAREEGSPADHGRAGRVPLRIWLTTEAESDLAASMQERVERDSQASLAMRRLRDGIEPTRAAWRTEELAWAQRCVAIAAEPQRWHEVEIAETLEACSSHAGTTLRAWVLHALPPVRIELLTFSTGPDAARAVLEMFGEVAWLLDSARRMALCKALAPCRQRVDPTEWTFDFMAFVMACEPMAVDLLAALLGPERSRPTIAALDARADLTPEEWTSIEAALDIAGRAAEAHDLPRGPRAPRRAETEREPAGERSDADVALELVMRRTVLLAPDVPSARFDLAAVADAIDVEPSWLLEVLRACDLDWEFDVDPGDLHACGGLDTFSLCRAIDGTADEATRRALTSRLVDGGHAIRDRGSVRSARGVRALAAVTTLENLRHGLSRVASALTDRIDAMRAWVTAAMPWIAHPAVPVGMWVHAMASISEMSDGALARVFGEPPGRDLIRALGSRALELHTRPEHAGFGAAEWALTILLRSAPSLDAQDRAFAKTVAEECARRPHLARRAWSIRDVLLEALADGADVHMGLAALPRTVVGIRGNRAKASWSRRLRERHLRGEQGVVRIARLPR